MARCVETTSLIERTTGTSPSLRVKRLPTCAEPTSFRRRGLSIPASALDGLSPTLQELTSSSFLGTTLPTSPQPILNLSIASNNGGPPVDVNLLGVVVTTSNVQVQLLAQPGQGLIIGNLVYNVSHLLDGGLLSVLGVLNVLGI